MKLFSFVVNVIVVGIGIGIVGKVRRVLSSGKYRKPRYVGYKNKAVDAAVGQAASETEFTQLKDNDLEDTPALQAIIRGQYPVVCEHARRFAESLTSGTCLFFPVDFSFLFSLIFSF